MDIKLDDTLYPKHKHRVKEAIKIANGIYKNVSIYGWLDGERNNQAVDWMIATHILGIDYDDAIKIMTDLIDKRSITRDKDDFIKRCEIIKEYLDHWKNRADGMMLSMTHFCCMKETEISWSIECSEPDYFHLVEE